MTKLDEIAINIELVLISIIEGVALTNLAEHAVPLLHGPNVLMYLPYVLSGLAILLAFWSQSILHTVSFIRWPIRMEQMFLYFVAAFVQIIAYSSITDLPTWFFWWIVFTLVALAMYVLDLGIIRERIPTFKTKPGGVEYVAEVEKRHMFELRVLVPIALVFNTALWLLALYKPGLFSNPLSYAMPGILQLLISIGALADCTRNFKERGKLLARLHS